MNNEPEKLRLRLGAYRKIDQAILEHQPLETIAELAVASLDELITCNQINITLFDTSCEAATVLDARQEKRQIKLSIGQALSVLNVESIEQLQQEGTFHVAQVSALPDDNPLKDILLVRGIYSYLVIPLISGQGLIGMLNVGCDRKQGFVKEEVETLTEIGGQLALSICQAQMNEQITQQKEDLSTLLKISYMLAQSNDLKEVMQITIDEATRVMGLETGAIYLLTAQELFLGATTPPLPEGFPYHLRVAQLAHHPHIKSALDQKRSVYLKDTQTAELTDQEKEVSVERGLRSLLYVPLLVGSRTVGVLIMGTVDRIKEFSPAEINLCRTFSAQMALAVENARLFQEAHLQASELERRVNERTAELEALTHAISHDLRAPLRAIQGFGDALIQDYNRDLDLEGNNLLNRMVSASEKLEGMLDRLLSLTRVGNRAMTLEHLDLSKITEKILSEQINAEKDREIEYTIAPCGKFCKAFYSDRVYIEILLSNLISNALKFTRGVSPARIEFGCYTDNDEGIYYLRDNGIGFDMSLGPQLFLPFSRFHSNEEFPGFGIGLTIVKKIIDLHNGRIWFESQKGIGTTVYFTAKDLAEENQSMIKLL